jgi:hypothetical protein
MMLVMARSEEYLQQLVASEAIIAAASKKKDASVIVSQGLDILKSLYKSKNDHIKGTVPYSCETLRLFLDRSAEHLKHCFGSGLDWAIGYLCFKFGLLSGLLFTCMVAVIFFFQATKMCMATLRNQ